MSTADFIGTLEYKEEVMKVLEADFWLMHVRGLQHFDVTILMEISVLRPRSNDL